MAKPHKAYQKVNTRKRVWVTEDGEKLGSEDVTLWLDPRGTPTFLFAMPAGVYEALGDWKSENYDATVKLVAGELRSTDIGELERCLERVIDAYVTHKRTTVAEPVLLIRPEYAGRDQEGDWLPQPERYGSHHGFRFDQIAAKAQLSYEILFRVGKTLHNRRRKVDPNGRETEPAEWVPGGQYGYFPSGCKVVDYTPEMQAELDRIIGFIELAARAMHAIATSEQPAAIMAQITRRMLPAPATTE